MPRCATTSPHNHTTYGQRIPSLLPHPRSPSFFPAVFPLFSILHSSCGGRGWRATGGRQRKLTSPSLKQVIYYQMKNWHDGGGRGGGCSKMEKKAKRKRERKVTAHATNLLLILCPLLRIALVLLSWRVLLSCMALLFLLWWHHFTSVDQPVKLKFPLSPFSSSGQSGAVERRKSELRWMDGWSNVVGPGIQSKLKD